MDKNKDNTLRRKHSFQRPLGCHHILTMIVFFTSFFWEIFVYSLFEAKDDNSKMLLYGLVFDFFLVVVLVLRINFKDSSGMSKGQNKDKRDEALNKTCTVCDIEVGDKTKHCRACNKCILNFDHHCVWLNTCIGSSNYKLFVLILVFSLVFCMLKIILNLMFFFNRDKQSNSIILVLTSLLTLLIIDAVLCFFLGDLIVFHIYLKIKGMSTYEHILLKRKLKAAGQEKKDDSKTKDPAEKGFKQFYKKPGILGKSGRKSKKKQRELESGKQAKIYEKSQEKNEEENLVDGDTSKRRSSHKCIENELVHDGRVPKDNLGQESEEAKYDYKDIKEHKFEMGEIRINKNLETDFNTDLNDEEGDKQGPIITVPEELKINQNKFLEKIKEEEEDSADCPPIRTASPKLCLKNSKKKEECDVPSECEDYPSNAKKQNLDEKLSEKVREMSFHSKNFMNRKKIKKNVTVGDFSTVTTKKGGSFKSSMSSNMKL